MAGKRNCRKLRRVRMKKPRVRMTGPDTYVYVYGSRADVAAVEAWQRANPPRGKPAEDNRATS